MKKIFNIIVMMVLVCGFLTCGNSKTPEKKLVKEVKRQVKSKESAEKEPNPFRPPLNVYNMGGAPAKDMDELVAALQRVYPDTRYAGSLALVDSCYIKNDPKGKNRYWWSKLLSHLKKTTDVRNGITLVIVNAEVCNWTKNGSHANLGMSNCGGHVSTISYQRLKVNHLNNLNDMMKVVIHELGHSTVKLVAERKDLRYHCPNANCLMKDANNGFPYRGLTSFCPSCSKAMKAKGFNLNALKLKEQ